MEELKEVKTTEKNKHQASGSLAILDALMSEGVDTIFGYLGGAMMPIYHAL